MNGGSPARWHDDDGTPRTGRARVTSLGLDLQADGGTTRQVDPRRLGTVEVRGDALHVTLASRAPGGAETRLVIEDVALLAPLRELRRARDARASTPVVVDDEGRGTSATPPLGLVAALAAVGLLGWLAWLGLGEAWRFVPADLERALGQLAHDQLVQESSVLHAPQLQAWLDDMARQLVDEGAGERPRIEIVADDEPNAFALPGGFLVVNRGLFAHAPSPEAVAGVLAHEVAHVEQRHGLRALLHGLGVSAALGAVLGSGDALVAAGAELLELDHSREAEAEADALAVAKLHRAGYSVGGLLEFLRALRGEGGELPATLGWLSTHPHPDERIARLEHVLAGEREAAREWVDDRAAWDAAVLRLLGREPRDPWADAPR